MKRTKTVLRVIAALTVVALAVVSVWQLGVDALFGRIAVLSVAATTPEGVYELLYNSGSSGFESVKPEMNPQTNTVPQTAAPSKNQVGSCVAIKEQVLGNIVKKTMLPYSANTSAEKVYINNQSKADIDIKSDLSSKLSFEIESNAEPQILIYHTHATEAYMTDESEYYTDRDEPRSTDTEQNVVKIGEIIKQKLESAGYGVVHDKTLHDHPGFSGSYSRSAETVKAALEKYPSIKIVIDVHRDSITSGSNDKVAPVVMVNGKEAAQVMLVMGSETGSIEGYPEWRENLKLATKLQSVFESRYPSLARSMLLKSAKYNQNLTTGSFLIEVGSDANTFDQAKLSANLVGESLVALLKAEQEKQ